MRPEASPGQAPVTQAGKVLVILLRFVGVTVLFAARRRSGARYALVVVCLSAFRKNEC
jgi:hypothetical protein